MWNISNILSLFRAFLTIPLIFAVWTDNKILVVIICLVAFISDLLDGFLARKLNQVTEFGKILDPLSDKVFVTSFVILLIIRSIIPLWIAIAIVARDILILIGGLYAKRRLNYVIPSNYPGKITVDIIALYLVGSFFELKVIINYGPIVVLAVLIISLIIYLQGMLSILNKK